MVEHHDTDRLFHKIFLLGTAAGHAFLIMTPFLHMVLTLLGSLAADGRQKQNMRLVTGMLTSSGTQCKSARPAARIINLTVRTMSAKTAPHPCHISYKPLIIK